MAENKAVGGRVWELDFLRGIALLLMITFHIVYDLNEIYGINVEYERGLYYFVGKSAAILFMLISGISCNFSRSNIKRGLKVLLIALIITVATHLFGEEFGIKFGILHFLGVAMLLHPLLNRFGNITLTIVASLALIIGNIFTGIIMPNNYLFIFNLTGSSFTSADYYPILPWIGIFIFGIVLGRILYKNKKSLFKIDMGNSVINRVGKHTLIVYILHQPIILLTLELINRFM